MGQCHPIPDDAHLKDQMRLHARNALKIHQANNLPYNVEPGSDLDKAIQLDRRRQAQDQQLYESEQDAEQRRLQRFARLRQKRAGGLRVRACPACAALHRLPGGREEIDASAWSNLWPGGCLRWRHACQVAAFSLPVICIGCSLTASSAVWYCHLLKGF